MRILVVEDEIRIRKGMSKLIESHTSHTVVGEAQNGQEGMEMALLYVPDLIITDIRMPVMDGLEMMHQLRENNEGEWHFVILSGYSEFEYAKKALQYGADDYLIKPLAPDDVIKLLDSIEEKLKRERRKKQEKPERMLRNYLIEKEDIDIGQLCEVCGFEREDRLRLVSAYVGNLSQTDRNCCTDRMMKLKNMYPEQRIYYFFTESTREFIIIFAETSWDTFRCEIEDKLLKRKAAERLWVWTTGRADGMERLRAVYQTASALYEYGLVLDTGKLIDCAKVDHFDFGEYSYPQKEKKQLQNAFYKKDKRLFEQSMDRFIQTMAVVVISPKKLREEYMQMAYFLLNLARENDDRIYEQMQNLGIIQNIGSAITQNEMQQIFTHISQVFLSNMKEHQNISNYVILRAIDYIRNHYNESISLEGLAATLDITPEYLSTLFNREVGETFSSFLKKFKISQAKRLLKETDKKIYEIAVEVGYSDPKYFNRVFKEIEGISPGDFRALNK